MPVRLSVLLFVNERYSFNSLQIENEVSIVCVCVYVKNKVLSVCMLEIEWSFTSLQVKNKVLSVYMLEIK